MVNQYDLASALPKADMIRSAVQAQASPWDALRSASRRNDQSALTEAGSFWPMIGLPNPTTVQQPQQGTDSWGSEHMLAMINGTDQSQWNAPSSDIVSGVQTGPYPANTQNPGAWSVIQAQIEAAEERKSIVDQQRGAWDRNIFRSYSPPDDDASIGEDTLKSAYARRLEAFQAPYKAKLAELEGAYGTRIAELQSELAGYRGGLVDVNAAYGDYADDAEAILKESAEVEAEMLGDSGVEEEVVRTYDEYEGKMQETLSRIDATGNTELAAAMADEVSRTEEMMVDGLRSDMASIDEMHRLASAQATALANMAWKDDAYNAERTRYELEAQINQAIVTKQDEIQTTRDEMTAALKAVRDQMGQFEMTPDEVWTAALQDYGAANGLNSFEIAELETLWADLMANPENEANYGSFKSSLQLGVNMEALAQLGLSGKLQSLTALLEQTENIEGLEKLDQMLNGMDVKNLIPAIQKWGGAFGFSFETDIPIDEAVAMSDGIYTSMLDLWQHYGDFKTNYESYTSPTANVAAKGSSAPSNWVNRYQPEYVHRREVAAPNFASEFRSVFSGIEGIDVGGLGYMRDPGDTGNGRATNSDHQSGGALDLYAGSHEDMLKIEAWANSHPAVSYVIYSGNKYHEKHHVHVSLRLGYGFTGA